jgi:hypothetical protein
VDKLLDIEPAADLPRIRIFAGPFGTGKTEVAINYALALASRDEAVTLTDLDVVTPYFRSREMAERLEESGVAVVAPPDLTKRIPLPAITARMWGTMERRDGVTVVDVGGDAQGARAIGQFKASIERSGYIMYLVLNPYRPFNATVQRIAQTIKDVEENSRLKTTALVSNPNLIAETTLQIVSEGHLLVGRASEALGLPIAFLCVEERLLEEGRDEQYDQPVLPLRRHFYPPWREQSSE